MKEGWSGYLNSLNRVILPARNGLEIRLLGLGMEACAFQCEHSLAVLALSVMWSRYAAGRGAYIFYYVRGDVGFELELDDVCDSHCAVCICTGIWCWFRVSFGRDMKSNNSCGDGGVCMQREQLPTNGLRAYTAD